MNAIEVPGPAGRLQGIAEVPSQDVASGMALLLHPHPLHEGTMDNKVVHTLARSFLDLGMIAVRFNFRGVGASEGSYGGGVGEGEDALAVADWMRVQWEGVPLHLGGFSFGAMIAVAVSEQLNPVSLVTIAPPAERIGTPRPQPSCPWLVVQGDEDDVVEPDTVLDWLNTLGPGPELVLMHGVGHFFHGRLTELRNIVAEFVGAAG